MNSKLVSILTPCYNSEKYIHRLLDSIVNQNYPNIEMFVIDDGSTDNSAKIIKSYIPLFESKGYSLTYVYQENAGQSAAINRGLKLFKGDYLVWPDSDDFYAQDNALEEMVKVLESSDESVCMVRCLANLLDENTLNIVGSFKPESFAKSKTDLFEDCLFTRNGFWFVPGDYMAKTSILLECIPNKEIYTEKDAGQNWQLFLPLLYKKKCLTIEKILYNVLGRADSHSRGHYSTFEQVCKRYQSYENTLTHTLQMMSMMPDSEKLDYLNKISLHYKTIKLSNCLDFKKMDQARIIYRDLKQNHPYYSLPEDLKLNYRCKAIPLGELVYRVIKKFSTLKYKINP